MCRFAASPHEFDKRRGAPLSFNAHHASTAKTDPKPVGQRSPDIGIPSSPELRPAEHAVAPQYEEKCRELAGYVLANQRGLNTPKKREELAASIQRAIENYLAFEKGKSRYT